MPTQLTIPTNLMAVSGGTVAAPILVDTLNDTAHGNSGMNLAAFVVVYNPIEFTVGSGDVTLGTISTNGSTAVGAGYSPAAPNGWSVASNTSTAGLIKIALTNNGTGIITTSGSGSLVTINFHVNSTASTGPSIIDLAANAVGGPATGIDDQSSLAYTLNPSPLNNAVLSPAYSYTGSDPDDGVITVLGSASHFAVASPASVTAGSAFPITVTAEGVNNNTITTYSGTVHFASSDSQAVLPADATLTNGQGTFNVTVQTIGNQTIAATDTGNATIAGTATVTANFGTAGPYVVSINRTTPAGPATHATAVIYTVTFNKAVTGVDPADFQLARTGTVAAAVSQVTPATGSVYTVIVGGISGSGTLA